METTKSTLASLIDRMTPEQFAIFTEQALVIFQDIPTAQARLA